MGVKPRVSLVTLGVADVGRAETFYRALGWDVLISASDGLRLFRTDGAWLALYPAEALRRDAGEPSPAGSGFRGVSLAMNLDSPAEVDEAVATAVAAGGSLLRPPRTAEWGGYTEYVADPDGHAWEVAFNPAWSIGPDGRPTIT